MPHWWWLRQCCSCGSPPTHWHASIETIPIFLQQSPTSKTKCRWSKTSSHIPNWCWWWRNLLPIDWWTWWHSSLAQQWSPPTMMSITISPLEASQKMYSTPPTERLSSNKSSIPYMIKDLVPNTFESDSFEAKWRQISRTTRTPHKKIKLTFCSNSIFDTISF